MWPWLDKGRARWKTAVAVFACWAATSVCPVQGRANDEPEPGTGTFKGVVTFKGTAPERSLVLKKDDPNLKKKPDVRAVCASEDYFSEELLVSEKAGNGLANVVIYLGKPPVGYVAPPVPERALTFDAKGCRFIPHVLVVRCNQDILIKNYDPVHHNVHFPGIRNPLFNQVIAANDRKGVTYTPTRF